MFLTLAYNLSDPETDSPGDLRQFKDIDVDNLVIDTETINIFSENSHKLAHGYITIYTMEPAITFVGISIPAHPSIFGKDGDESS